MEVLYKFHQLFINSVKPRFLRTSMLDIDWNDRLIAIKGARGVGKTTFLAQHIKETFKSSTKALYITMDNLAMKGMSLFDIAEHHNQLGGTHLFIDEVHKYPDWSFAIKNIHDFITDLHVVFTGSSLLALQKSQADLSRRVVTYDMCGLSLREYINIELGKNFSAYTIEDIVENHIEIAYLIQRDFKILKHFNDYLKVGYYPFYLEGKSKYNQRLEQTVNTILDVDMPYYMDSSMLSIYKLKKFLHLLANSVPFQPNISKLSGSFELPRNTLNQYLYHLDEACLLSVLLDKGKFYSNISKPEKIYIHNPNLIYVFSVSEPNIGTVRETFFVNQVRNANQIHYSAIGDFLVNEKFVFEIGGKDKTYKQIANVAHSYIVSDDLTTGVKNKIPLWLFGFLY
jgi:uncharacterized protein